MTTPQTANELLDAMRGCGFTINLIGDSLEVRQARWIDDELAGLITRHKAELIRILEKEKTTKNLIFYDFIAEQLESKTCAFHILKQG